MTRSSIVSAVVVAVLIAILLWWRGEGGRVERSNEALSPPGSVQRAPGEVLAVPTARPVSTGGPAATAAALGKPRLYETPRLTQEMQARRQRVLDALRERAAGVASANAAGAKPPAEQTGTMRDLTGKMGPEVKALNEQFGPLVDQCFDQAKERGVRGHGMLAVAVKLAGAEGIGRIVESLEPAPNNAIRDPELIDCLRQSAFTVDLPPPRADSTSEATLTIPFEGAPDAGGPADLP